jgi:hypothetical protein
VNLGQSDKDQGRGFRPCRKRCDIDVLNRMNVHIHTDQACHLLIAPDFAPDPGRCSSVIGEMLSPFLINCPDRRLAAVMVERVCFDDIVRQEPIQQTRIGDPIRKLPFTHKRCLLAKMGDQVLEMVPDKFTVTKDRHSGGLFAGSHLSFESRKFLNKSHFSVLKLRVP